MSAPSPSERSFVTHRPVAILMLFIAAVVFGLSSLQQLPVTLMPELTYPTLTVRTEYPGAAPEEVENDISRPIEDALGVVGGLEKISSVSRAGVGDVILEFSWDTDLSDATQSVLERLDLVFLPDEAKRPLILHFDPELDPIMELSLSGSGEEFEGEPGLRRLRRLADLQVKRALEPITGVAAVRVLGGLEEEIHVQLDESQLRRTNLSIRRVIDRLAQENINVAGGTLEEGQTEYLVRTLNEYENLDQIANTIIASINGRDVRLRDIGSVSRQHKERQIHTRADGGESVQIEIYKEADANIVALAKRVKRAVGRIEVEPGDGRDAESDADATADAGDVAALEDETDDEAADDEAADDEAKAGGAKRADRGRSGGGIAQTLYDAEGASLQVVADRSLFIEGSIRDVRNTALIGGLLAIIVLFIFLRDIRTTSIIAVSIPVSLLVTFAPLHLFSVTLNIMSLGGLALGIGMLVDSSIVVLESIHRCREEGDDLIQAAIRGTSEVRSAVAASTLTSIAVFFPMVFVKGVAGQAFGDLGIAVVVSLLAAAAVALYLIPMLASRTGTDVAGLEGGGRRWRHFGSWATFRRDWTNAGLVKRVLASLYWVVRLIVGTLFEGVGKILLGLFAVAMWIVIRVVAPAGRFVLRLASWRPARVERSGESLHEGYARILRSLLARPGVAAVILLLTLAATWLLVRGLPTELLPEVRQGEFTVEVALPVGTPLEQTEAILAPVEAALLADKAHIQSILLTMGFDPAQSERSDEGEHTARFKVLLDKEARRAHREDAIVERVRTRFRRIPGLEARITRPVLFSSKTPIEVEVHGDDLTELRAYGDRVRDVMASMPELADVSAKLRAGAPEIQIVYDRDRITRAGLNLSMVADIVRDKVKGFEATKFNLVDRRVPIIVQLAEKDRRSVSDVSGIVINPGGERPIGLGSMAEVVIGEGPSEVRRIDSRRVALVEANIAHGSLGGAVDAIEAKLNEAVAWPADMTFFITGQNEEWERSKGSLYLALALSVFLVYVIMAIQFESLVHPFVIMFSIPLAFFGTFIALRIAGIALSVVVILGMIMLAGIVVNNAIVLVDYINQLRRRGLSRDEAIVTAGSVRLRPILMTTATTVLGLLPMALGFGDGAEIRTPMAIAVISGLLSSTLLTLLVIPSIYAAVDTAVHAVFRSRAADGDSLMAEGVSDVR